VYIVYILKDQGTPFYVGKGSSSQRAYSHERYAISDDPVDLSYGLRSDYNPHKTRRIRKLLREGRKVEYEFIEMADEIAAFQEEKRLINLYGRCGVDQGGILTNIHPGGIGGDAYSALTTDQQKNALRKRADTLAALPDEIRIKRRHRLQMLRKQIMANMPAEKKLARAEKIAAARLGRKFGPSSKRGKPATGANQKGVRKAWNKGKRCPQISEATAAHFAKLDRQWSGNTPFKLRHPSGQTVEGNNLGWLMATYDVTTRIRPLIRGHAVSYKGWMRAE
jgi:hypothetical protein